MENRTSNLGMILEGVVIAGTFGLVGLLFLFLGITFLPVIGIFIGLGFMGFGISCGFRVARGSFTPAEDQGVELMTTLPRAVVAAGFQVTLPDSEDQSEALEIFHPYIMTAVPSGPTLFHLHP